VSARSPADGAEGASAPEPTGLPLELAEYPAVTETAAPFRSFPLAPLDRFFLPPSMASLWEEAPLALRRFVEDDNRGAVSPEPIATLDGLPFYLSVKGVGSTVEPFSYHRMDGRLLSELTRDPDLRRRLLSERSASAERWITGELWLRGSPYGGQGGEHAATALRVSERADLTSLRGFRIAPVVKVAFLPPALEARLKELYWYRRYPGRIVQELRLVPSNVRVYLHAQHTIGHNVRHLFDRFGIDSSAKAHAFEVRFLRSAVAMLSLFARTLRFDVPRGRFAGLDFHDVWLDKDAVLAPDGTVFFVDLEGIEEVFVDEAEVREKLDDQVFRSLYELAFAYEQIDRERMRRFGGAGDRRARFAGLLEEALVGDPVVRPVRAGTSLDLLTEANAHERSFRSTFRWVDG
jgi:hypothetical protein